MMIERDVVSMRSRACVDPPSREIAGRNRHEELTMVRAADLESINVLGSIAGRRARRTTMSTPIPTLEAFLDDARAWLDDHAERAPIDDNQKFVWGQGEFSVAVFHALERGRRARAARAGEGMDPGQGRARVPRHRRAGRLRRSRLPPGVRPGVRPAGAGVRAAAGPRDPQRHDPADRADDHAVRDRGATPGVRAPVPHRPGAVLPAVLRTRRRVRPRRARAAAPSATATSGWSTARRCGARAPSSPSGAS